MKKKHDPTSEAALKECLKNPSHYRWGVWEVGDDVVIRACLGYDVVCRINLSDFIKKRQPLTGITKKLKSALRSTNKKKISKKLVKKGKK